MKRDQWVEIVVFEDVVELSFSCNVSDELERKICDHFESACWDKEDEGDGPIFIVDEIPPRRVWEEVGEFVAKFGRSDLQIRIQRGN